MLSYDEEPVHRRRTTARVNWVVGALMISVVLTALLWFGFRRLMNVNIPLVLLFVVIFAVQALRRLLASIKVAPPVPTAVPGHDGTQFDWDTPDGVLVASGRWSMRLSATSREAARFTDVVTRPLIDLVDERLRLRHGVERSAEPDRARALMGDQLWSFLFGELRASPTPAELADVVARIEAL